MAPIVVSVEINRSPTEVFAYLDQLERHGEWQDEIVGFKALTEGPTGVGTRAMDTRRVMGNRTMDIEYEITEHDPPRRTAFKGVNGMVRVEGIVTVEPLDGGTRSNVTLEMDFKGRGLGVLMAPMVRGHARRTVPNDHQRLKERLEAGA